MVTIILIKTLLWTVGGLMTVLGSYRVNEFYQNHKLFMGLRAMFPILSLRERRLTKQYLQSNQEVKQQVIMWIILVMGGLALISLTFISPQFFTYYH